MITPHKYLNLHYSTLNIGKVVLSCLLTNKAISYDDLLTYVMQTLGDSSKENFLPSLNFLFLLGKIEYSPSKDLIKLIHT